MDIPVYLHLMEMTNVKKVQSIKWKYKGIKLYSICGILTANILIYMYTENNEDVHTME